MIEEVLNIICDINANAHLYFKDKKCSLNAYVLAICSGNNVAKELNIGSSTLSKYNKELFPNKPSNGKILNWLLSQSQYKLCTKCSQLKIRSEFRKNKSMTDGLNNHCKPCHLSQTKLTQPARQAQYYASREERTPTWANLDEIRRIYLNCPEGYHVDHIIPLRGKLISGLHIETNLQYLPAIDNLIKGNSFKEK